MTNSTQKLAPSSLNELKEAFAKLSTERIRLEAEHFRIASLIQDAEFNARLGVTKNMAKKRRVIAVDLDGTLAKTRSDGLIGDPVKPTVDRVKRWHSQGKEVVIFYVEARQMGWAVIYPLLAARKRPARPSNHE